MTSKLVLPNVEDLVSCSTAVAGHDGTMSDPDGELFIKPCTEPEVKFYQLVHEKYPDLAAIMPQFYGTLALDSTKTAADTLGKKTVDDEQPVGKDEKSSPPAEEWKPGRRKLDTNEAIVLENSSAGFKHPSIIDCKLGTRLWGDGAPQAKRERMDAVAAETTHHSHGFRIAGMRVYQGAKKSQAPPSEEEDDEASIVMDKEGYLVYKKKYGRYEVNASNLVEAVGNYVLHPGLPVDLSEALCHAFVQELTNIEAILEKVSFRMYSGSLLFVYEGDKAALRHAIEVNNNEAAEDERPSKKVRVGSPDEAKNGEKEEEEEEEGEDSDDEEEPRLPRIFSIKLIDFAHSTILSHANDPDPGVMKGIRNLKAIFQQLAEKAAKL